MSKHPLDFMHFRPAASSLFCLVLSLAFWGRGDVRAGILDTQVNPTNGHTYHLLEAATWTNSEAEAVTLGGHLVTINDAEENTWVFDTFANFGGEAKDLWIGLNDVQSEGDFVWSSGETSLFTNWQTGQPDGGPGNDEHYAQIYAGGTPIHFAGWVPGRWNDFNGSPSYTHRGGFTRTLHGVVEVVPEPSAFALACMALVGGLFVWRVRVCR